MHFTRVPSNYEFGRKIALMLQGSPWLWLWCWPLIYLADSWAKCWSRWSAMTSMDVLDGRCLDVVHPSGPYWSWLPWSTGASIWIFCMPPGFPGFPGSLLFWWFSGNDSYTETQRNITGFDCVIVILNYGYLCVLWYLMIYELVVFAVWV